MLLAANGSRVDLRGTGLPLGVDEDAAYTTAETDLRPGDVVFACTDGLTEARREGRQFGDERLDALLAEHGRVLDPDALVHLLQREVEAWAPSLDDDMVILALRRQA
jgi:serine phosphatase RsbU (regulator of sigma subunit)